MSQRLGLDYGIKPRVMVLGDQAFIHPLSAGLVAVGYTATPEHGLLIDVPTLVLIFKNEGYAVRSFEHFERWVTMSESGDAVRLTFVEFDHGGYGLFIYPEQARLIQRCLEPTESDEFDTTVVTPIFLKRFPEQSSGYFRFKAAVDEYPYLIVPGTVEDEILEQHIIQKREISFYRESDLPLGSIESGLLRQSGDTDSHRSRKKRVDPPDATQISLRRASQLRKFFPVTLERLRVNNGFAQAVGTLLGEGYAAWQVIQAACNIVLQSRFDEAAHNLPASSSSVKSDADGGDLEEHDDRTLSDERRAFDYLIWKHEEADAEMPSDDVLSLQELQDQIKADTLYLLRHFENTDRTSVDRLELDAILKSHGLLSNNKNQEPLQDLLRSILA